MHQAPILGKSGGKKPPDRLLMAPCSTTAKSIRRLPLENAAFSARLWARLRGDRQSGRPGLELARLDLTPEGVAETQAHRGSMQSAQILQNAVTAIRN